jgi:hypothetical protein
MPRYPSKTPSRATLSASSTKLRTAGRAGLLGDRDEVAQVPQFDIHPEHNPNRRARTGTVDTIAFEGGLKKT